MKVFGIIITCSVLLLMVPPVLTAGTMETTENGISLTMEIKYFVCDEPSSNPPCIAFNDQDKVNCKNCRSWEEKSEKKEGRISNNTNSYMNKGNYFLQDTAEELYGVSFPKIYKSPVKIGDIYANFESYGWVEVGATSSKVGALALFPGIGGFIIKEGEKEPTDISNAIVYYPSSKKNGRPSIMKLAYLGNLDTVKFLIPKALVQVKK